MESRRMIRGQKTQKQLRSKGNGPQPVPVPKKAPTGPKPRPVGTGSSYGTTPTPKPRPSASVPKPGKKAPSTAQRLLAGAKNVFKSRPLPPKVGSERWWAKRAGAKYDPIYRPGYRRPTWKPYTGGGRGGPKR